MLYIGHMYVPQRQGFLRDQVYVLMTGWMFFMEELLNSHGYRNGRWEGFEKGCFHGRPGGYPEAFLLKKKTSLH